MLLPCVVLFSLLTLCSPVLSECWNYDGTNRNEDSDVKEGVILYEACDRTQPFSMCCRQPGEGDECRLDGLCQGFAGDGSRPVWRESCTDRTWDSPYCLDLCVDGRTEDGFPFSAGDVIVNQCPDNSWCCGEGNTTCCGTSEAKWIFNGKVTSTNPYTIPERKSSSSSSTSSSSTSSTAPTDAPNAEFANQNDQSSDSAAESASASEPDSGTPVGAIAGGVIGGVAALALLVLAMWFLRRRGKKNRQQKQCQYAVEQYGPVPPDPRRRTLSEAPQYGNYEPYEKRQHDVDGRQRYEIGDQAQDKTGRQELP